MNEEQRKFRRLAKPMEATWQGASGGAPCRITDISWGGCFIQSMAEPVIGEQTTVAPLIGGRSIDLPGTVAYRERGIGFAIEFEPLTAEQIEALKEVLGEPE